ncbi:MAG: hypothetical protein ACRDBI_14030, partial [Shewanella sp.]
MGRWLMATRSRNTLTHPFGIIGVIKGLLISLIMGLVMSLSPLALANEALSASAPAAPALVDTGVPASAPWAFSVDIGWDSRYVSQGRNNLQHSGIYWLNTAAQYGNLTTYAILGRGANQAYTEWNLGLEYALKLSEHLEANVGYQRIEGFSESRCQDNELFANIAYNRSPWLVPSISYVYATEAAGYFIEASLHSYWQLSERVTLTPYITQGFDVKYATPEHNGRNH